MVKEFNGNVEVHLFLVWPQNYKICFLCVEIMFAISQLHTMATSLLALTSSDLKFFSA